LQSAIWRYWHDELIRGWEIYDTVERRKEIARFIAITGRTIKEAYNIVVQVYPIKAAEQAECDAWRWNSLKIPVHLIKKP
jgi:hypothetical protein